MNPAAEAIENRLSKLESHLEQENPILLNTVQSFRQLDRIAYRMGLLQKDSSFATQIPWWPLVSVLGTFSSGKSTFINHFLQQKLQRSGNQAVDDKFTVICYSREETSHALPGVALDSDPRFPFYQMSEEIEQVASGEGERIDAYLQLKTCPSEHLQGKILIDSPGFDADAQRTSTLRITDHIIDLSDLVLVFFDARHPEPESVGGQNSQQRLEFTGDLDQNLVVSSFNQLRTFHVEFRCVHRFFESDDHSSSEAPPQVVDPFDRDQTAGSKDGHA